MISNINNRIKNRVLVASTFLVMLILGACSDVRTYKSIEDMQFK